jgi:hypothetical protein
LVVLMAGQMVGKTVGLLVASKARSRVEQKARLWVVLMVDCLVE